MTKPRKRKRAAKIDPDRLIGEAHPKPSLANNATPAQSVTVTATVALPEPDEDRPTEAIMRGAELLERLYGQKHDPRAEPPLELTERAPELETIIGEGNPKPDNTVVWIAVVIALIFVCELASLTLGGRHHPASVVVPIPPEHAIMEPPREHGASAPGIERLVDPPASLGPVQSEAAAAPATSPPIRLLHHRCEAKCLNLRELKRIGNL